MTTFFLDIYNELLKVNDNNIFIIFDEHQDIWFSFTGIMRVLGYKNPKASKNDLNIDSKYIKKISDFNTQSIKVHNLQPHSSMINEAGLYDILSKSNKPLAKIFMEKYKNDTMPQIRKSGIYVSKNEDIVRIKKLNTKIYKLRDIVKDLKNENKFLEGNYRFVKSELGYGYIKKTICVMKGKKQICYKFGITDDINKTIKRYHVGNPTSELLYYIPLQMDIHILENRVKNILKPHSVKNKHETFGFLTLKDLITAIIECSEQMNAHICHCGYCLKIMKLNKLTEHECSQLANIQLITLNGLNESSKFKSKTKSKSKSKAKSKIKAKSKSKIKSKIKSKAKSKIKTKVKVKIKSKPKSKSKFKINQKNVIKSNMIGGNANMENHQTLFNLYIINKYMYRKLVQYSIHYYND